MRRGLLLVLLALLPAPARAWHEDKAPVTEHSAATLREDEWKLGLATLEYGLTDRWEVGAVHLFLIARIINVFTKVRVYDDGFFSAALSGGVYFTNLQFYNEDNPDLRFYILPFAAHGSLRWDDLSAHLTLSYTLTGTSADDLGQQETANFPVQGSLMTGVAATAVEWRLSRSFALLAQGRLTLFQAVRTQISGSTTFDEGRTTLEIFGEADVDLDAFGGNVSLSAFWSWEIFNLKLGLGYGRYIWPFINVMLPDVSLPDGTVIGLSQPTIFPEFSLFWRW